LDEYPSRRWAEDRCAMVLYLPILGEKWGGSWATGLLPILGETRPLLLLITMVYCALRL